MKNGKIDSAFYYLNKAKEMSVEKIVYDVLPTVLNTMAELYEEINEYEKALQYYYLTLKEVRNIENQNIIVHQNIRTKGHTLSRMGNIFYEINITDSALHYINLSKIFATENKFPEYLMENYLTLSKIEESKGNKDIAFDYFRKYANLKDSMQNAKILGEIKQLQRLYEVSKTDKQIEYLVTTQYVKEQTIHYQRIIIYLTYGILLFVLIVMSVIVFQKRKLSRSYKLLFEKNVEIVELKHGLSAPKPKKIKSDDDFRKKLLDKVLEVMENTAVVCNSSFSIIKLAAMTEFNDDYISEVINSGYKMNFRSFLNGYRIREAQRLISLDEHCKFTIEALAEKVGYKSRNSFTNAFKEVTGISPSFYMKSLKQPGGE